MKHIITATLAIGLLSSCYQNSFNNERIILSDKTSLIFPVGVKYEYNANSGDGPMVMTTTNNGPPVFNTPLNELTFSITGYGNGRITPTTIEWNGKSYRRPMPGSKITFDKKTHGINVNGSAI